MRKRKMSGEDVMPFSATKRWVGLWVQYGLFPYPEWLVVMWGCGCSMGYFSTQSVGGGWGCGCSMGYFSTQSGWLSFIRVPMVVEGLKVCGK